MMSRHLRPSARQQVIPSEYCQRMDAATQEQRNRLVRQLCEKVAPRMST